jgi:hypothetical protein
MSESGKASERWRNDALSPALGTWHGSRGRLKAWHPANGLLFIEGHGHLDEGLAGQIMRSGNEVLESAGRLCLLLEFEHVLTYDSAVRTELTRWVLDIRERLDGCHILVESKLLRMGVSVASLALGDLLISHRDRPSLLAELKRRTRAAERDPRARVR